MNLYYYPENFGLEPVGQINWINEPYEFEITAVWKKKRGEYYFASDSGCSCPTPFDYCTSVEKLNGPYNKTALAWNLYQLVKCREDSTLNKSVRDILDRIK